MDLAYTTFALSDMQVAAKEVLTDGSLEISCKVKNIGDVAGDEIVQLYTSFTEAHVTRPKKQLSGFKRITLQPEEEKRVVFRMDLAQLGYYNEDMEFVVEPGTLHLMMGFSSQDLPLSDSVQLIGNTAKVMGRRSYVCPVEVLD